MTIRLAICAKSDRDNRKAGYYAVSNLARVTCVVSISLLLASVASAGDGDSDSDSAAALLESLRAKDKAFDNAILRYTKWGEWVLGDTSWRFPQQGAAQQNGAQQQGPQVIKYRHHDQLVVRGRDTTFISEADPDMKRLNPDNWVSPYHKWGLTGTVFKDISDMEGCAELDFQYETRTVTPALELVSEQRMAIEFAHGFGFGERIKTIESVVRAANMRVLTGTIQLWDNDVSTFRIELGDDLVVKNAVIETEVDGLLTRREVTTEGAVERAGFVFARAGHYKEMVLGFKNARKKVSEAAATDEFRLRFVGVRFNLRDDVYNTLATIEIPPGTLVRDYISNKVYQLNKDNTVNDLGRAVAK